MDKIWLKLRMHGDFCDFSSFKLRVLFLQTTVISSFKLREAGGSFPIKLRINLNFLGHFI